VPARPPRRSDQKASPSALTDREPASSRAGHEPTPGSFASDAERLASFQRSLDALLKRVEGELGAEDVAHIRRIQKLSQALEVVGRGLLHVSLDPLSFSLGVLGLSAHKALELMEIGHTVLHGTYDKLEGAEAYRAKGFYWRAPIDEASWCVGHNVRHHQYTNVAGRDPDLDFGQLRLSERIPFKRMHRLQPLTNLVSWSAFANAINLHVTGLLDLYLGKADPAVLKDHSFAALRAAHVVFLRKYLRYHVREYVLFPALAGPFFWKPLLGNILSDMGRDIYAGAIIYSGHVGATDFPSSARAGSRAAWYEMQVEAAYNIDLPHWLSVLAGALDKQIEHHLFPRLPPNRLREIAPEVRAICASHGVKYRSGRFPERVRSVLRTLGGLSLRTAA
jgi:linoleoyl-CoA desaturase